MAKAAQRIKELEELLAREASERQKLELELRESEARFHSMARNQTEIVMAYDMNRRLTFANTAVVSLTGYSRAELEKQHFICWIHEEDRSRMLAYWDRLFEGQGYYEEEYRMVTRQGRIKWMSASWGPILDEEGHQIGVQGREREVSQRRLAEETQRMRELRYRSLFEDSPFPMWEEDLSQVKEFLDQLKARGVTDIRSHLASHRADTEECIRRIRVIDVNRTALEFYGATREELLGNLSKIFDAAAYEVVCEEMSVFAAGHSVYRTEFETHTMKGEQRTVTMIVSLEPSPADWSRVIVSFFDITDHKRLEEQMLQAQRLESLGQLAGGVAHDFNNLLMVIVGYSDLLLGNSTLPPTIQSALTEIRKAGHRGSELTGQLLAFSRKQVGQPRAVNLNSLVRDSQPLLQRAIGEEIELALKLDPDLWTIRADSGQMNQILTNLVTNAREAMPSGGVLTISTGNEARQVGDFVHLVVADTGIGMDAQTRQHVFDPFFTTKKASKGAGLGLATVFGVVTQSGGHLSVTSAPGEGTAFNLYFPRVWISPPPERPPVVEAAKPSKATGTILLVEDQSEVRELAATILRQMGFAVVEAGDGTEAIGLMRAHDSEITMVLTDVLMPGMNGRELAERIRQDRPQMKIIFMSGYSDRLLSRDGMLDDSVVYLQKPFTSSQLSAVVRRVLG